MALKKKGGVDYGLSSTTMNILGEAAKAEAGVGKYASEGFDNFLDTVGEYAGKKMDEAALKKQAVEDKFNKAYILLRQQYADYLNKFQDNRDI